MVLKVVKYGHPVLRKRGARIEAVTPEIKRLIADMFETMVASNGVGLAAQQVGETLQLTVIDVREAAERPSTLELNGQPTDPSVLMPLVLINPESVDVKALNEDGQPITFRCGGLLARAVQHETDHLNGILFIDRMEKVTKADLQPELDEMQAQTKAELKKG